MTEEYTLNFDDLDIDLDTLEVDPDEPLVPHVELREPFELEHTLGVIPRCLGHAIDACASLLPLSKCFEQTEFYGYTDDEGHACDMKPSDLSPEEYEAAKKYWVYYRKMSEHVRKIEWFNANPGDYYRWLMNTNKTVREELESHWLEINPAQ